MKTILLSGAAALALVGLAPVIAQTAQTPAAQSGSAPAEHMRTKVHTRAEVQAKVAEHFGRIDTNRDGFVTREEAAAARGEFKARFAERSTERRLRAFDRLDADNDGAVSREEWTAAEANRQQRVEAHASGDKAAHRGMRMMRMGALHGRMFEMSDANKDGRVSLQEAQTAALQHFDMGDTNRDGQITPDERRQMHERMKTERRPG